MSKRNGDLLRSAREHVFAVFRSAPDLAHPDFHQFARTDDVVRACREIAKGSKVEDDDREVALLCAWFYDACYAAGSDDHRKSLEACIRFVEEQRAPRPTRDRIVACFGGPDGVDPRASDGSDGSPSRRDVAADVLHDARLAFLASDDYVEQAELLRVELDRRSGKAFSDVEWTEHCLSYFDAHPYRTRYAQLAYGSTRAANVARLRKQLRRQQRDLEARTAERSAGGKVGKAAESIYYHFTRIQLGLIGLADHRTSTMIHVNAIMMSLVMALLGRRIETDRNLLLPTVLLLTVNLTVIFLSIYSMRTKMKLTPEEASQASSNLITLSDSTPVTLSQYRHRMGELIDDPAEFKSRVIDHLYFGRKVLADRARTLRLTYGVFIYGVTLASAAFIVVLATR